MRLSVCSASKVAGSRISLVPGEVVPRLLYLSSKYSIGFHAGLALG